jgi:hypothetical protein
VPRLVLAATLAALTADAAAADRTCPIPTCNERLIIHRAIRAADAPAEMNVDGRLDEPAWAQAARAADFMQSRPVPGAAARLRTEARVLVNADALYVGVRLYDENPIGIVAPYLRRDNEGQSDWVFVEVDSRGDRRSAFSFGLNPRGVQVDGVFADDVNYDTEWNGTWQGAARIDDEGWTAEFRIPLSQLAFANGEAGRDATWGFNVYRYSPQHGEASNWSPRFTGLPGVVSQFNDLHLTLPRPPRRLEIAPFVAPKIETSSGATDASTAAGADLTVGLGPSFALMATILPDFGQVEADPAQINLTTFELFQTERRPFFVEGASAFSFNAGMNFVSRGNSFAEETAFYSRRVGKNGARIIGAIKVAGRTREGWTVGLFGAATERLRSADGPDVEPSGVTALARASRSLRAGESAIGFVAGFVDHPGIDRSESFLRTAAVYGVDARHRFHRQQYEVDAWALGSRIAGPPPAIEAIAADPRHARTTTDPIAAGDSLNGIAAQARLAHVTGSWLWNVAAETISRDFEINEIGFQRNADWNLVKGDWRYQRQTANRAVRRWTIGSDNLGSGWTTRGERRALEADAFVRADFRNYWDATVSWRRDLSALSIEWLRGGPALRLPARDTVRVQIDSDTRRRSIVGLDASASREPDNGSCAVTIAPQTTWRTNDRLEWTLAPAYSHEIVGWQFVTRPHDRTSDYIVGRLKQQTLSMTTRADLIFTVRALLQIYVQPFVASGRYDSYQRLVDPRAAIPAARFAPIAGALPVPPPDSVRYSSNATVVFRWEYRPASFVTAVWNRRQDASSPRREPLGDAIGGFDASGGTNVFLLKTSLRLGR